MESKTPSEKPIHYIMWEIGFGGLELSINHYVAHFSGYRPLYAYSLRPAWERIYDETKISVTEGPEANWPCYRDYFRYCSRHRCAIFHLMNVGPAILLLTLLAGVKHPVYHIHGTKHWRSGAQKIYLKLLWGLCSMLKFSIVANSAHSASVFNREVLAIRPVTIYNGFATKKFIEKRRKRTSLRKIGYAGRLNSGKNVHLVIRLFEEIAGRLPQLELWIAGNGPLRNELEKQAAQGPFGGRIIFLGNVEDMPAFYSSLDLLVFLSAHESFGNVLVEALLTGLPLLTSGVPVFEEIHGGEKAFLLGDPDNYEKVKANFLSAIDNFSTLSERGWQLSERVEEQFSAESHLQKFEKLYENTD